MKDLKTFAVYCLAFCLISACTTKGQSLGSNDGATKAFTQKYKTEADTCINLSETKRLFIKESEEDYTRKVNFYVFENKSSGWDELFSLERENYVFFYPVDTVNLESLDGKDYLYMEYQIGGGNMGNNLIDFSMYDLNSKKEYIISYEYFPDAVNPVSDITSNEELSKNEKLFDFLYKKVQASNQYKSDGFIPFIDKFCSDKNFQLSRIKSPVNKSTWKILTRKDLTPHLYKEHDFETKWVVTSENEVHFVEGWIESEVSKNIAFKKIKGEWFVTGFYEAE